MCKLFDKATILCKTIKNTTVLSFIIHIVCTLVAFNAIKKLLKSEKKKKIFFGVGGPTNCSVKAYPRIGFFPNYQQTECEFVWKNQ